MIVGVGLRTEILHGFGAKDLVGDLWILHDPQRYRAW
ncbi:hypothetical protein SAMN05443668_11089 [Cryptosporangium aurantiacum]|uniref:Uncharacterized protein n=1 Tax=Cryptosporangium aurantiacum TaxID=134849 RepID=A0A1M7RD92_9ACTN|nr:hypothetical protein SAMN05443668_11089 [Cryptosporangium aurantiacum]